MPTRRILEYLLHLFDQILCPEPEADMGMNRKALTVAK